MSLRPKDPKKAWKRLREWRERSVRRYEERLRDEGRKFSNLGSNPERRERRYERDFGDKADKLIRPAPCDTCGAPPPSDPSHYPSRGAGGTSKNLFPQCADCHDEMHSKGVDTFLAERGYNRSWLEGRTGYWERRWRERQE